jgi:hypothetical protein
MNFSKAQADADLASIADVVARVKQSRIYRVAGAIAVMWGFAQFVQYAAALAAPAEAGWSWMAVDAVAVALTVLMLRRAGAGGGAGMRRALAAFALFYAFGFVWSGLIGHFSGREQAAFWHTLFLFGYCLAGLWFGVGFLALGACLALLVIAVYLYAGPWFWLAITLVTGFGYILCGLWMRRA